VRGNGILLLIIISRNVSSITTDDVYIHIKHTLKKLIDAQITKSKTFNSMLKYSSSNCCRVAKLNTQNIGKIESKLSRTVRSLVFFGRNGRTST